MGLEAARYSSTAVLREKGGVLLLPCMVFVVNGVGQLVLSPPPPDQRCARLKPQHCVSMIVPPYGAWTAAAAAATVQTSSFSIYSIGSVFCSINRAMILVAAMYRYMCAHEVPCLTTVVGP